METVRSRLLVDIVTDVVCPWCYVGLRSFNAARERLDDEFDVRARFRPYLLNPATPEEGFDREAYYAGNFADAAALAGIRARIVEAARGAGFAFDPARPKRLPNTMKAHCAMRWAQEEGRQDAFALALYGAFWDEGADIGDARTLASIAGGAGLNESSVREKLRGGVDRDLVADEADEMRGRGISGVPTFIVNERRGFSGGLPPKDLEAALRRAAQLLETT